MSLGYEAAGGCIEVVCKGQDWLNVSEFRLRWVRYQPQLVYEMVSDSIKS